MVSTGISAYCRKPAGPPAAPEKQEKLPPGHGVSRADVYFVFAAVPESGQRNLLDLDGLDLKAFTLNSILSGQGPEAYHISTG